MTGLAASAVSMLTACGGCGSPPGPDASIGAAGAWTVADLGPGRCISVNASGQVLGIASDGTGFITGADQTRTPLGNFSDGAITTGVAIADNGDVVGYSDSTTGRVAVTHAGDAWHPVAAPGALPGESSTAIGADDSGHVVGVTSAGDGTELRAFLVASGEPVDLSLPDGSSAGYLVSGDRIAGIFETADGQTHAFAIADGELTDLGTLGGTRSAPSGMNRRGVIVGAAETATGVRHAFAAEAGAALIDLGVPASAVTSEARGIDDLGRIAGNAYDADEHARPIAFVRGGEPVELLPGLQAGTGETYLSAYAAGMAPDGQIAGWAVTASSGATHCLLWTPTSGQAAALTAPGGVR